MIYKSLKIANSTMVTPFNLVIEFEGKHHIIMDLTAVDVVGGITHGI